MSYRSLFRHEKSKLVQHIDAPSIISTDEMLTVTDNDMQAQSVRVGLVGVWELVSYQVSIDGPVQLSRYPLSQEARGSIIYTMDGHVSVQIMKPGAVPFKTEIPYGGSKREKSKAMSHYMAYGGTYRVCRTSNQILVIEHNVDYSLFPNWVGQKQLRIPDLKDDHLILKPLVLPSVLVCHFTSPYL